MTPEKRAGDRWFTPSAALGIAAVLAALLGLRHDASSALAVAATLAALLVFSGLYSRLAARSVRARREIAPRAFEDEPIEVRFRIENRSPLPLYCVEVDDWFPADRSPRKRALVYPVLPPRSAVFARYRAECDAKRGPYEVGPTTLSIADPLGLAPRSREEPTLARLLVYPGLFPIARMPREGVGVRYDAGSLAAAEPGFGLEFLGTREYRAGDSLRFIHWPSTARAGQLIVKQFEETTAADVAIFLDLARLSLKGLGRASTIEHAVRIAASVAYHYAKGPNRVRLFARGSKPVLIPQGSGEVHLAELFHALALVRPDGETPFAEVLRETAASVDKGSTVVAIFSSLDLDLAAYADILALYRARGVRFLAVLVDDRTFLKLFAEQTPLEQQAPPVPAVVTALLAEGATVYTVARHDDLPARFDTPYEPREGRHG